MGILNKGVRLATTIIAVTVLSTANVFADFLTNPGFELGEEDGLPLGWESTVSDSVEVTRTEGSEYPT